MFVNYISINKEKNIYTWFLSLKKSSGRGLFVSTLPPSLICSPHTSPGETVLRSHVPALPGSPGQAAGRSGEPHRSGGCEVPMQSLPSVQGHCPLGCFQKDPYCLACRAEIETEFYQIWNKTSFVSILITPKGSGSNELISLSLQVHFYLDFPF